MSLLSLDESRQSLRLSDRHGLIFLGVTTTAAVREGGETVAEAVSLGHMLRRVRRGQSKVICSSKM